MNTSGWLQLALYVAALALITKPMGLYLMQVLDPKGKTWLDPVLRPLTGRDQPVIEFLDGSPLVQNMFSDIRDFVETWLPGFVADNRSYLTVAIGCTGGQHRSVYLAERLTQHFKPQIGVWDHFKRKHYCMKYVSVACLRI